MPPKCFRGPLGDLHCAKTPFLFLPPTPSLTAHSAPSEGSQESQWWRRGLWSPSRQCLFLYPLGPEVTGWGGAEMTSAPGPTCLSLWRVHLCQGQGKRSGVCWLRGCLRAAALHLDLMASVLREQDNPTFRPTLWAPGTACSLFQPEASWTGAVSGCILNPILFSMLQKIRFFCGKTAALHQVRAVN